MYRVARYNKPSKKGQPLLKHSDLIVGLGVEIIDIARFTDVLARFPRAKERLFTDAEIAYCEAKTRPETHFALTFATKQAALKVLGEGFCGIRFSNVAIERDSAGQPIPHLSGAAFMRSQELGIIELHLSTTYTHTTALASAIALTQHARPVIDEDLTFDEKMTHAFREIRTLLDEPIQPPAGAIT